MSQVQADQSAPAPAAAAAAAAAAVEDGGQSPCESPPVAPAPPRDEPSDPRVKLLQLAAELARSNNRRLVVEYLRLRRAIP